ncbi:hypothetical protein RHMOL_Rhmol11G0027700 [Rhododendron molle]|uniref:Uncharacterized protein n=1 Tax=Rhododendron molle TaxID=49168 RepID=A0ACC0LPM5_RHOML|nr:hypothetical protein RHMOL_Rhmol11G0027700 [Rhododendron molle]
MAEHGNGSSGGEVIDQPEDLGEPMVAKTEDQTQDRAVAGSGAAINTRAVEAVPRATDQAGTVGSSGGPEDSGMVAEGLPVVGGGSGDGGSGDAGGDESEPNQTSPRDSAKGKGAVVEGEETTEAPVTYREEDVLFQLAATLSSLIPITKYNVTEHLPDEALAKLLEDNPMIGEIVLKAKEDRDGMEFATLVNIDKLRKYYP